MKILQSTLLSTLPNITHGFFYPGQTHSRPDTHNNFSFKNGQLKHVLSARNQACQRIQLNADDLTYMYQVHGTTVWKVEEIHRGAGAQNGTHQIGEGDAMVTNALETPIAILIADCLPVFMADKKGRAAAIIHAGWRGSLDAISIHTLHSLHEHYGIEPQELYVWIAPGISHHHFEIGKEVWEPFKEKWGHVKEIFHHRESYYLDLKHLNQYQLESAGVLPQNIEVAPQCTYQERSMFSYRRDGAGVGHNLAVIGKRNG